MKLLIRSYFPGAFARYLVGAGAQRGRQQAADGPGSAPGAGRAAARAGRRQPFRRVPVQPEPGALSDDGQP